MAKGGGSSTQTVKQDTTPWNSSYLTNLFDEAKNIYANDKVKYYPDQTLYIDPRLESAYSNQYAASNNILDTLVPAGNSIFNDAAYGRMGIYNSPAYSGLSDISTGNTTPQSRMTATGDNLNQIGLGYSNAQSRMADTGDALGALGAAEGKYHDVLYNNATTAVKDNPASPYLNSTAAGDYLNSNPYLDAMYDTAARGVARTYQTATAPQTDSRYELAGRYGSGAMMNERQQNRLDLGTTLNDLASGIYGKSYESERDRMVDAAKAYGEQYLGGVNASTLAAGKGLDSQVEALKDKGALDIADLNARVDALKGSGALDLGDLGYRTSALNDIQGGYDTGNQNALRALSLMGSTIDANLSPYTSQVTAGKGLTGIGQANIQDLMDRYYGKAMEPWKNAQMYSELLGNPITGSTTTTSPLYSNTAANVLGTGLAGTSLLGSTGAFGKSGWLTGGDGLLGGLWGSSAGTGAATGAATGLSALASGTAADASWATPSLLSLIGIL